MQGLVIFSRLYLTINKKRFASRRALKFFISKFRGSVAARETTKCALVRAIDVLKKTFRELGRIMVKDGIIPDDSLVYHFSYYELKRIVSKPDPKIILKWVVINGIAFYNLYKYISLHTQLENKDPGKYNLSDLIANFTFAHTIKHIEWLLIIMLTVCCAW